MANKFPEAAREQNRVNTLISLMFLIAIFTALWLILVWGFKQSPGRSFFLSWAIILVIACVPIFIFWFRGWKQAGGLLLNLFPYPQKTLTLGSGILFLLFGLSGGFKLMLGDSAYAWLISILIGLAVGIYDIGISFSHIGVHEHGFMLYRTLIKWGKIESFQWISAREQMDTLKLEYKSFLPGFMLACALPVPLERRPELESILEKHLSASVPAARNLA